MKNCYECPFESFCKKELRRLIEQAFEALAVVNERAARAADLCLIQGMKQKEAGQMMGTTRDVIAHLLKYAREFLRDYLGGDYDALVQDFLP